MVVTFFDHAQFFRSNENEQKILSFLEETVGNTPVNFYLGGYGDFDELAYTCCKKYKASHPQVSLIFITPYMTTQYRQSQPDNLKRQYDEILFPDLENKPLKFAVFYRNRWMVEHADCILCGITHSWGGAYQAVLHAKRKNKPIFNIGDVEL